MPSHSKSNRHNHPSFIEPFQGATTGVGGILRDIFTMGARPIAVLDAIRSRPLDDPPSMATATVGFLEGVVRRHRPFTETASACPPLAASAYSSRVTTATLW